MNFTYPAFLTALSAIAIPIIIHLFNFRKFKTIYFSNVKFLKEVKQETQSRSKLKHLLVLISRILAITFLVLAFAQPYLPDKNHTHTVGTSVISVFVDNSFSMDAVNTSGTLLDDAKKKAAEIVASYKATDRFQLLTNDFEGKHQRLLTKEEFLEMLEEVRISPVSRKFSEINSRSKDVLNDSDSKNKQLYVISDFQRTGFDIDGVNPDTLIRKHLIPVVANENSNVFIDTCWFDTPVRQLGANEKLHVRLKNISDKVYESNSIKLFINGSQKTPASFTIQPGSQVEVVLAFASKTSGVQHCVVEINDFPITFDDKFYFTFNVAKSIPVLSINAVSNTTENNYLSKLFASDSGFIYTAVPENQIDYSSLSKNRLVVLNQLKNISSGLTLELQKFVTNGGSLVVFPGTDADLITYNSLCAALKINNYERLDTAATKVDALNSQSPVYRDVFDKKTFSATNLDLPKVFDHYVISKTSRSTQEYLMKLQNGDVFMAKYESGKGKVYLSAVPLNQRFSNFSKHAIIVPTLYKIAVYSQQNMPLFYSIGNEERIEVEDVLTGENVFRIKNTNSDFEIIPEHRQLDSKMNLFMNGQITQAGNYDILADKTLVQGCSFNYNRSESDMTCYTSGELQELILDQSKGSIDLIEPSKQSLTQLLTEKEQGTKLWKLCIILALLFLGAEVLLLRYMN